MRASLSVAATVILIVSLFAVSSPAVAQRADPANDLGMSENDVRDEPDNPDDMNGFQNPDNAEFFSPQNDELVLDSYAEVRAGHDIGTSYDEDVSNVVNVLLRGENTDEYEHFILPGRVNVQAWWGYWSDTGGGGSLQATDGGENLGFVGDSNGVIDDADDCSSADWDEFIWRGANSCAENSAVPAANTTDDMDSMWGFVQPGTHVMHVNSMILGCSCPDDSFLANGSDADYQPDWRYQNNDEANGQEWTQGNGFARYYYDTSLVMSTQILTSVNPKSADKPGSGPAFDPYTGSGGEIHKHDVDVYSSLHPVVEDTYRLTVWDPPQDYGEDSSTPLADQENVFAQAGVHDNGLKGFAKYPFHDAYTDAQASVFENVSDATEATEPATGVADDLVFGPYFHEPNHPEDEYLSSARDNATATTPPQTASFDAATTYGGLDQYYDPGSGQTYDGYADEEHFWLDAQAGVNTCPLWIPSGVAPDDEGTNCYNGWAHVTPEIPSTAAPVDSTTSEEDDNSFGPTVLYLGANAGTWHDDNGDTWVGDPTGESDQPHDDPYNEGNTDDPNQYGSDEFRGSINVVYDAKLVPTGDSDGDGVNDWGTTGVYVMGTFHDGNPYSDAAMDVVGPAADPVLDPARNAPVVGNGVEYMAPQDDDRLTRYRTQGNISMNPIVAPGQCTGTGCAFSGVAVVFPAGNLDVPFKVITEAELTDKNRASQNGLNDGDDLQGEAIKDVDEFDSILGTQ